LVIGIDEQDIRAFCRRILCSLRFGSHYRGDEQHKPQGTAIRIHNVQLSKYAGHKSD
jgi:hypothetical protein